MWPYFEAQIVDWLRFVTTKGVGPKVVEKTMELFDTFEEFLSADQQKLQDIGWPKALIEPWMCARTQPIRWLEPLKKRGIVCLPYHHPLYPPLLRETGDAPTFLLARGNLEALQPPSLSIVGTRHPSEYGIEAAQALTKAAVQSGRVIVSGLAFGIDAVAHQTALINRGTTIAVLAGSLEAHLIHPAINRPLAANMLKQGGLLLSETIPDVPLAKELFPRRNRILVGLSPELLVVEAGLKSGSLVSAQIAVNINRDVLSVPGSIFSESSEGCHALLAQGARIVKNVADLRHILTGEIDSTSTSPNPLQETICTPEHRVVYNALEVGRTFSLDELTELTQLSTSELLLSLSALELSQHVMNDGGVYRRA